jgi:Fe-S oxidoreductase/nitrate reductase gamma subunit
VGTADDRVAKRIRPFIATAIGDILGHRRFLRERYAGTMHLLIFWGFVILLVGAAVDFVTHVIHVGLTGGLYFGSSLLFDVGGLLALAGTIMAVVRRYGIRPERLKTIFDDGVLLSFMIVILITGFVVEGVRQAATELPAHLDWAVWSPGGLVFAQLFKGMSEDALLLLHRSLWWFHAVVAFGGIVYMGVVFSKLQHVLISPLNMFLRTLGPVAVPSKIDIEHVQTLGVGDSREFTWKQLLDVDACTNCGRCQDRCPAYLSGKPLSPRKMTQDIKAHWLKTAHLPKVDPAAEPPSDPSLAGLALIGDYVSEDEIWACTTCGACQETCPVYVEHITKVIDMRRNLVLMQSKMPETAQLMLRNMDSRGHPWAGVQSLRLRGDWTGGQDVTILGETDQTDVLLWVGCTGALVDRNVAATLSLVKILKAAGINFAVLGEAEACCGDPARRAGYEIVFQTMAEQNIAAFKAHGVKEIITSCPHCYNTLKNEYPQYGADFKVVHYTDVIADLVRRGRLKLTRGAGSEVTYHDPCYLGRYNGIYEAPREVLRAIPQTRVREMDRSHNQSFCCGGGGAHMWMEENVGRKINEIRIEDVLATGADTVVTSCPYCLQMLEEGIERKELKATLKAKDLSEMVEAAL